VQYFLGLENHAVPKMLRSQPDNSYGTYESEERTASLSRATQVIHTVPCCTVFYLDICWRENFPQNVESPPFLSTFRLNLVLYIKTSSG